jgi:hypothetical protein
MRVIGLMSGTSVDGIDAALVEVAGAGYNLSVDLVASHTWRYPAGLRQAILELCGGDAITMETLAQLDDAICPSVCPGGPGVNGPGGSRGSDCLPWPNGFSSSGPAPIPDPAAGAST